MKRKQTVGDKANDIVGIVSGVKPTDTRLQAARKAINTMRAAGFSARDIAAAERMYEAAKRRGVS